MPCHGINLFWLSATLRLWLYVQVGTDVDALAVKAAQDNAELNSVAGGFAGVQCSSSIQVHAYSACKQLYFNCCETYILCMNPHLVHAGYQALLLLIVRIRKSRNTLNCYFVSAQVA